MKFLVLAVLLPMPVYAAHRLGVKAVWLSAYMVGLGAITYWTYAIDKRRAEKGRWRIPEAQLHLLEALGGWPGAFLAQRRLRHKCSKGGYQVIFWCIVLAYQAAACDSLQDWRCTRAVVKSVSASLRR